MEKKIREMYFTKHLEIAMVRILAVLKKQKFILKFVVKNQIVPCVAYEYMPRIEGRDFWIVQAFDVDLQVSPLVCFSCL